MYRLYRARQEIICITQEKYKVIRISGRYAAIILGLAGRLSSRFAHLIAIASLVFISRPCHHCPFAAPPHPHPKHTSYWTIFLIFMFNMAFKICPPQATPLAATPPYCQNKQTKSIQTNKNYHTPYWTKFLISAILIYNMSFNILDPPLTATPLPPQPNHTPYWTTF